jgi:hypothetical protein
MAKAQAANISSLWTLYSAAYVLLVVCFAYFSTVKMDVVRSSET